MRSMIKVTGTALVVALGLSLSACASSAPEAFDASKVSCETVATDITSTQQSLSDAQSSLKENKGTPGEVSAQADISAAQAKLDALNERSESCNNDPSGKTRVEPKMTDAERDAIIKALTVSTTSASAVCKTDSYGNVAYVIDSLLGVPPRLWPDAISTKITASDPVAARVELQEAICKDPNLGVAWLTFVATTVRDKLLAEAGIDLLTLNPRLKAYTDVSQITPKATEFVPLLNIEKPTTEQVDNAVKQNAAWQQDAALINTLLERFAVLGIEARQSLVNYHLTDYALDVDSLPTVGVNDKEENLPALIFAIVEKGQCGEIIAFGANIGDKRPELFEARKCTPPTPPTTTSECKTNCGGNPPCTYNCGEKTDRVPREQTPDGGVEPPAPAPTTSAAPPEPVDTTPVEDIDTDTDLPSQDTGGTNTGVVTD